MFTGLQVEKGVMAKQFKTLVDRTKHGLDTQNVADWFNVIVDENHSIDVRDSVTYVIAAMSQLTLEKTVYKYMEEETRKKVFNRITSFSKSDGYDGLSEEERREQFIMGAIVENKKLMVFQSIASDLYSNSTHLANIIAEAVILTTVKMSMDKEICVSPFNLHSSVLYYWAIQRGILSDTFLSILILRYKVLNKVDKEKALMEFINSHISDDFSKGVALKYLIEVSNGNMAYGFMGLMDEFVEATSIQIKSSKLLLDQYNTIKEVLLDKEKTSYTFREIVGQKINEKYIMFLLSSSAADNYDRDILYYYIYRQVKDNKIKMGELKKKVLADTCEWVATERHNSGSFMLCAIIKELAIGAVKNLENTDKKCTSQQNEISNLTEKLSDFKRQLKDTRKKVVETESELKTSERKIAKLERDQSIQISSEEIEQLHSNIKCAQDNIYKQGVKEAELTRTLGKKVKEIGSLQEKLGKTESDYAELEEKYTREKELSNQIVSHRAFNEIPIEVFVKAISTYKIILIGGDMMHPKLKEYGLSNIRYYKAGCKELTFEDISSMNLIVVCTSFVDHSSTELVMKASKTHNIPLLKFNNKNSDILIYSIFSEIYK